MQKPGKKIFAILLVTFFLLNTGFCFADLEVKYPTLASGATLTASSDLTQYLKYIFDLGISIGFFAVFLSLVWAGVLYLLSPAKPSLLADAKDRISGAISGLLILVTLVLIITTINPQLAIFNFKPLDEISPPATPPPPASVNFYKSPDCSGDSNIQTTSIQDLGDLTNKINSVKIIPDKDTAYITILYDIKNFWGKCQYINPDNTCEPVNPFAASASIYPFDFNPAGNGVFVYRNSFFNQTGGWLKISNDEIKNEGSDSIYVGNLEKMRFTGDSSDYNNAKKCTVPKEEQDCVLWDKNGTCLKKQCPNLANENISSIKIDGSYIVLLIYFDPSDKQTGPWTYCQAFPSVDDANKIGPQQIKWSAIRNRGQNPNSILIIPVTSK